MTILETNSKNLNDKIQSFREINLSVIRGLSNIHGIVELTTVKKALELANLNAWNAQIIIEKYPNVPKIECTCPKDFVVKVNEVRNDEVQLAVCILEAINELITTMPEFFVMLEKMDKQLGIDYKNCSDTELESQEQKIESITHTMKRTMDCLMDAVLWNNLFLERKSSLRK